MVAVAASEMEEAETEMEEAEIEMEVVEIGMEETETEMEEVETMIKGAGIVLGVEIGMEETAGTTAAMTIRKMRMASRRSQEKFIFRWKG